MAPGILPAMPRRPQVADRFGVYAQTRSVRLTRPGYAGSVLISGVQVLRLRELAGESSARGGKPKGASRHTDRTDGILRRKGLVRAPEGEEHLWVRGDDLSLTAAGRFVVDSTVGASVARCDLCNVVGPCDVEVRGERTLRVCRECQRVT